MAWPHLVMRHPRGGQTVELTCARGRWSLVVSSDDPLNDGYDEVSVTLDEQSIQRLRAFLETGDAPTRDEVLPDLPAWTQQTDRPADRAPSFTR